MSAAEAPEPSRAATGSTVAARLVLALWLSVCTLSLLLIALTIAFHLSTRYDWYFHTTFHPWRTLTVQAFAALGAPILGALIVWHRPGNRYGWVWCVFGFALAVSGAALAYELWALYVAPVQPRGLEAAWLAIVMQPLTLGLFPLLLLLFPDGRPPSPRWRPVVWATLTGCAVWTLATAVAPGIYGFPNPIFWLAGTPGEVAAILAVEIWRPYLLVVGLGALSVPAIGALAVANASRSSGWPM